MRHHESSGERGVAIENKPMVLGAVAAAVLLIIVAAAPAWANEPAKEPDRVLFIGGYQSQFDDMPQMTVKWLQHVGFGESVECSFLASDAHATPTSNHRYGAMTWIRGTGEVSMSRNPRGDAPYAEGRIRAAVLEVGVYGLRRFFDTDLAAIRDFAAAAAERKLPAILFLLPEELACTHKGRLGTPSTYQPRTLEDYRADYRRLDEFYQRVMHEVDIPVAPVHRVFLELRERSPALDLHPWRDPCDGHLSPRDHYVAACTIAAVLSGKRPEPPPAFEAVTDFIRIRIDKENEKNRSYGRRETVWYPIGEAENRAIYDAIWAGVDAYEAERQAYWKRIPKTAFALDAHEIQAGSSATLRWKVDGVDKVVIEPDIGEVPAQGERVLKPSKTTTYALQIRGLEQPHPTWTQELVVYELLPAVEVKGTVQPGLRVAVQEVEPNFAGKKLGEVIAPRTLVDKTVAASVPADIPVDLVFSGFIKIDTPGPYRFFGVRGGNTVQSELSIAGHRVYSSTNAGGCVLIGLAAGWHPVQGRFRTREGLGKGGMWFDPGWILPGKWPIRREVPRENVFWCEK